MERPDLYRLLCRRCGPAALLVAACIALPVSAQARVVFPSPGVMDISGLPSQVHAGKVMLVRDVTPLAIFSGEVRLQRHAPDGSWQTVASAPVRPRVFWLRWKVPSADAGSSVEARFVLVARDTTLAVSPSYTFAVVGSAGAAAR